MPSAAMTTPPSALAPLANDTFAMLPCCSKPVARCPVCTTPGGKRCGQYLDEVGAVHAEGGVPARGVGDLHRRDRRAVMAEVVRARPNPRAALFHRRSEAHPLQLAHAVRRQKHPGADFAEARGLLINRHPQAMRDQRVGGEQPADPAANDDHIGPRLRHHLIPARCACDQKCFGSHSISSYSASRKTPSCLRVGQALQK